MDLAMIGLGKMGLNMATRLVRGGHRVVGFAPSPDSVKQAVRAGAEGASSLAEAVRMLKPPRIVWLMIPAGAATDAAMDELSKSLSAGDCVVDGGNSNYRDSIQRAQTLASMQIDFVDCGTSGGIWGLDNGYGLMIGGKPEVVERLRLVFECLAPGKDIGWGRVGPHGAGHYVKMIHNGIEYGMMQALAEGFSILQGRKDLELDIAQIAEIWRHGSVVRSWLLDLTARALKEDARLTDVQPWVEDSGEGRWTVQEAIEQRIAAPVITLALQTRFASRDDRNFTARLLAAMRNQFGGHAIRKAE
jgi:6-phosphogluconate dehydrogenase